MSLEGNYSFSGIGAAEAKDRENEHPTSAPPQIGRLTPLLAVALRYLTGVRVMNQGSADADVRLAHGSKSKTQTAEKLTAHSISTTVYQGRLQFGSITPGTFVTAVAAGPGVLTDDGAGLLLDAGLVQRGTIDYATGTYAITFASAVTELVTATYDHTDWTQFAVAQTQTVAVGGAFPETLKMQFGRTVPGSVSFSTNAAALTFTDDGKGNIIETTAGNIANVGTIDYGTGIMTLTTASATLTTGAVIAYSFNPLGAILAKGGGQSRIPLLPGALPEFDNEAWADGVKGETEVALLGESRTAGASTPLWTYWAHHVGDDQGFRVRELHTAFPSGGQSNDTRVGAGF